MSVSDKAVSSVRTELKELVRDNARLTLLFAGLSGLAFLFAWLAIAWLLIILSAVFGTKVVYYWLSVTSVESTLRRRAVENSFEQRIAEMDESEFLQVHEDFGYPVEVIHAISDGRDIVKEVIGRERELAISFRSFREDCARRHSDLKEEIEAMRIVGIAPESDTSVFVYFSGLPGELFSARYVGHWEEM